MATLVLGCGRSGKAAEALLKAQGRDVVVLDGEARLPEAAAELAVVSPGVPLTHPWAAECRRRGIPLKSELQLGCEELKRRGWKLLAVTGSKGKSSVVKVVAEAICLSGGRGVACGNYGLPVCEVALSGGAPSWAVVEVSSFMMETTELPPDTFEAAAILNLQEDHLDRHGSVGAYHGLKRRLLSFARERIDGTCPIAGAPQAKGSYFDNPVLRTNGACAAALMRAAGLEGRTVEAAFRAFEPLPHRMNLVAERRGVRYVDDSKATSLAALAAGVEMAASASRASVLLIAGGLPKGDDPKDVLPTLTSRVRKVYLIGQSAKTFFSAWSASVDCEVCGGLERAVEAAVRDAVAGETVLLSPGAASYDQFRSFGERGDVFAGLVKKGKTE